MVDYIIPSGEQGSLGDINISQGDFREELDKVSNTLSVLTGKSGVLISAETLLNSKIIYVDSSIGSDRWDNNGLSPYYPFRSINRACIEVARRTITAGPNNDEFNTYIIDIKGSHTVINNPGSATVPVITNLEGEPTGAELAAFNPTLVGGLPIPRGASIRGQDLRKTIIRPNYVPGKTGTTRSSIFKLTGNCFFFNFTFNDKINLNESHHNLSCFEFVTTAQLSEFYTKVQTAFGLSGAEVRTEETQIVGEFPDTINPTLIANADTTRGASPYIFNCSVRSNYGLCGIDGDGSLVSGLKSAVAAQFTIVSLQKDFTCWEIYEAGNWRNATSAADVIENNINNVRIKNGQRAGTTDCRHFGYRASNDAYFQLVSCFNIGTAVHVWALNGGDISITNSTSNFGGTALQAEGFKGILSNGGAYPQDRNHSFGQIKVPKPLTTSTTLIPVGTVQSVTATTITLVNPFQAGSIAPFTLKNDTAIWVNDVNKTPRKAFLVASGATVSTNGLTINVKSAGNEIFPLNPSLYQGQLLYIRRRIDTRSDDEKLYKIVVDSTGSGGRTPPINYLFRLNYEVENSQIDPSGGADRVFYNSKIFKTSNESINDLVLLRGDKDGFGLIDSPESLTNIKIDTDFDDGTATLGITELGTLQSTSSYQSLERLLSLLGFTTSQRNTLLTPNQNETVTLPNPASTGAVPVSNLPLTVEFNRPSLIRAGQQTFEWAGYGNYSTSIPKYQDTRLLDTNAIKGIRQYLKGGRVYYTGLDEEGNYYILDKRYSVTGQTEDLRFPGLLGDVDQTTFENLFVTNQLKVGQTLDLSTVNTYNWSQTAKATTTSLGVTELATTSEAVAGVSNDVVLTPAALAEWAREKRVQFDTEGTATLYLATVGDSVIGASPRTYDASYRLSYWPDYTSLPAGRIFAPLATLNDAANWCRDNLADKQTANLIMRPGKYYMQATFDCAISINGANGNGQIGRYDGTDNNSVILYSAVYPGFSDSAAGGSFLKLLYSLGFLRLNSPTTSTIQNIHFWGPFDAVKDPTIVWPYKPVGTVSIPAVVQNFLNEAPNANVNPTFISYWITRHGIILNNSSLTLSRCVIGPQAPAISGLRLAAGTVSYGFINSIGQSNNLTLTGVRIRGNGKFEFPSSQLTTALQSQLISQGANHVCYGWHHDFIVCRGSLNLTLGSTFRLPESYDPATGSVTVSNFDWNNNRLERNTLTLNGTTDVDYRGTALAPGLDQNGYYFGNNILGGKNGTGTVNTESEILGRGPMLNRFIWLTESPGTLSSPEYGIYNTFPNPTQDKTAGWRGQFGDVPVISSGSITSTVQMQGIDVNQSNQGIGNTLFAGRLQYTATFWKRAGAIPPLSDAQQSNTANILTALNLTAVNWTRGFYNNTTIAGNTTTWLGLFVSSTLSL